MEQISLSHPLFSCLSIFPTYVSFIILPFPTCHLLTPFLLFIFSSVSPLLQFALLLPLCHSFYFALYYDLISLVYFVLLLLASYFILPLTLSVLSNIVYLSSLLNFLQIGVVEHREKLNSIGCFTTVYTTEVPNEKHIFS